MTTNNYYHKVVVITGGSSGIGFATAKEFAKQNAHITLIARNRERLEEKQAELKAIINVVSEVNIIQADVSVKSEITNAVQSVGYKYGKIDVLINCAGISSCGRFSEQTTEELEKCLQVNYIGAVYASKAGWPYLKIAKGQLSFVSSVAGYLGLIGYSAYAPTKFAMSGLAECLRYEGKDDNIQTSIIYPPDTDTPLLEFERKHTLPECLALSKNIKVKSAETVARFYIKGLEENKFEIYCDAESKFVRWFKNNFPSGFFYLSGRIIERARSKGFS